MEFQDYLEIGLKAEDLVSKIFTKAGYEVWDVGSHPLPIRYPHKGKDYKYLHVDKYVIGEGHRFWLEIKARKLSQRYLPYIDTYDKEWLIRWHIKTGIPPFIVFALYEDIVENSILYIISLYKARDKGIEIKGISDRTLIKTKDMVLLDDWLIKIKEYPNKWQCIV